MTGSTRPNRSGAFLLLVAVWLVVSAVTQVWRRSASREPEARPQPAPRTPITGVVRLPEPPSPQLPKPASEAPPTDPAPRSEPAPKASTARGVIRLQSGRSAPVAIAAVSAVLALAALLNAEVLLAEAEQKPFGRDRDFWVATWEPLAEASDALYLNRPRRWLDDALGREPRQRAEDAVPVFVAPPPLPTATPTPSPTPTPLSTPTPGPTATPTLVPTPTPPPKLLRAPAADAPLRLWVGGDSISGVYGESLVRMAIDLGYYAPELDYRVSSGLTRVDYFDWPTHLANEVARLNPDVVVVMFGANDTQGIVSIDGNIYTYPSDGWKAEYRRRVAGVMDLLYAPGRMVVWAGQPIMESDSFTAKVIELNNIYRSEAEPRSWVVYFDTFTLLSNEGGGYAYSLPDANGNMQSMRAPDGIHLSRAGGDRLAAATLELISSQIP